MKKYLKYIFALILLVLTSSFTEPLLIPFSTSPDGTFYDLAYIKSGISLIVGVIVSCTALIIFTIKENSNK